MKVVVYPHDLSIGGSQLNAIELGAAVARRGHEVVVFGRPGKLVERIDELGLEFIESPKPRRRPSPSVTSALLSLVHDRGIDVLHGYEWPPALECWLAGMRGRIPAVATVMSMAVAGFLPRTMPLTVGTEQIAAAELATGRSRVVTMAPPVDLEFNNPELPLPVDAFKLRYSVDPKALTIAVVTRLAVELKLEGLLTAIDVVGELAAQHRLQLLIVGDGPARRDVELRAEQVNVRTGKKTIVLTGELSDPRPAYACADIMLGQGGSALRALAFGKPLIVQGEDGFWRLLEPDTAEDFGWTGWYGVGSGRAGGPAALRASLAPLLADSDRRRELSKYSLDLVRKDYSLSCAAEFIEGQYELAHASMTHPPTRALDAARTAVLFTNYYGRRMLAQLRRRAPLEDFNAKPVARNGPRRGDPVRHPDDRPSRRLHPLIASAQR